MQRRSGLQRGGNLPDFFRAVLARERRPRHQVLAHREAPDQHRFVGRDP